jgi:hypothetical protein
MSARRNDPHRHVEVLEEEAWEVPDCLFGGDWRAQAGLDGRRAIERGEEEEDER